MLQRANWFSIFIECLGAGGSLGITCILSGFQAIAISPSRSQWMELKAKTRKDIRFSIVLCWTLYMLVNGIVPLYITDMRENQNYIEERSMGTAPGSFLTELYPY